MLLGGCDQLRANRRRRMYAAAREMNPAKSSSPDNPLSRVADRHGHRRRVACLRMRILLLDDSPDSCSIIAAWLNAFFGAVVIESAASGDQALNAIARRRPELVLATHPMGSMDGIALARIIKARPNPPAVVVINTGSDAEFEWQCAAAGADFCVEKRHLQARLLAFLQQRFSKAWAEGVAARRSSASARRAVRWRTDAGAPTA